MTTEEQADAARDASGWSALDRAAGAGDAALVRRLLEQGADPTAEVPDGRTPYRIAAAAGHLDAARLLRAAEDTARGATADRRWRPYSRAYRVAEVRAFAGWPAGIRSEAGAEAPAGDDEIVYLHDDLTLTRDVWRGENVLLDAGTPGWQEFCRGPLAFEAPDELDLIPAESGA